MAAPELNHTAKIWRVVPFAFAVLWSAQAQSEPVAGVASVIDGDTLEIHGQRVRLFGIDAPESGQPCETAQGERWRCGRDAAIALADLIGRAPIQCDPQDIDRYGRVVAVCYQGNLDIGAEMVRAGWAVAYRAIRGPMCGMRMRPVLRAGDSGRVYSICRGIGGVHRSDSVSEAGLLISFTSAGCDCW